MKEPFSTSVPLTPIRVGVVGCGSISRYHIQACQTSGLRVSALCDSSDIALSEAKKLCSDAVVFPHAESLLDSGVVDAVCICTPPDGHAPIALGALERGIHVLCEKPLAHKIAAGEEIVAAAGKAKALFMTAFRHRFIPAVMRIRKWIQEGKLGELVFVHNTFCGSAFGMKDRWFARPEVSGGGALMDTSIHSVDLFRFLAGEVVEQQVMTHRALSGIEVEDTGTLVLKSVSGAIGSLSASWVSGEGVSRLEVIGQRGRVAFDYRRGDELVLVLDGKSETAPVCESLGFAEQWAAFAEAIRTGGASPCPATEGMRALEIIQSCYGKEEAVSTVGKTNF